MKTLKRTARRNWSLLSILIASPSVAQMRSWQVAPDAQRPAIEILLPYSVGTHKQTVGEVRGQIRANTESLRTIEGLLTVPINSIVADGGKRDCHMREALGLDYKSSRFPKEHVCDDGNRLPSTGPDGLAFPEIQLELKTIRPIDEPKLLDQGKSVSAEVQGTWTIHGVSRPAKLVIHLSREGTAGALRVRGREWFALKDFGIVVKPAQVLFASITAGDVATANIDLLLRAE